MIRALVAQPGILVTAGQDAADVDAAIKAPLAASVETGSGSDAKNVMSGMKEKERDMTVAG